MDNRTVSMRKYTLEAKCKKSRHFVSRASSSIQQTGTNKRRQVRLHQLQHCKLWCTTKTPVTGGISVAQQCLHCCYGDTLNHWRMAKLAMSHCQKNLVHINMSLTLLHTSKFISKKSADMGFPNSMAMLLHSNGCRQSSVGFGMANMLSQWRWRGTVCEAN